MMKLPEFLDLDEIRKIIPHTIGEHPPNENGDLLCNGHCNWNTCNVGNWICKNCDYIECNCCAEDFEEALFDWFDFDFDNGEGDCYCRNCGHKNTIDEYLKEDKEIEYKIWREGY